MSTRTAKVGEHLEEVRTELGEHYACGVGGWLCAPTDPGSRATTTEQRRQARGRHWPEVSAFMRIE